MAIAAACGVAAKIFVALSLVNRDVAAALTALAYFVISVGYGIGLDWFWNGQTLGKRVMRLKVVDATGMALRFSQVANRNLLRFLDAIPLMYLVGGAAMLWSERSQRIGDQIAGTIVIKQVESEFSGSELSSTPEKYNSLLQTPHLAARLRQRATPELAYLAYEALSRRDALEPAARLNIFQQIAGRFRLLVAFPEEVTESLTDERYVRNALEVLTTSRIAQQRQQRPKDEADQVA